MTPAEFKLEFQQRYDAASLGGPDLNDYEISRFLTEAIRRMVDEAYKGYESSEYHRRLLNPLIKESTVALVQSQVEENYYNNIFTFDLTLPTDLYYILQENVVLENNSCNKVIELTTVDLDNLTIAMKNPFKKPNKRKVLRAELGARQLRLYSSDIINTYKLKYIKQYTPLIVATLTGGQTIDGETAQSNTELPVNVHYEIVKLGVLLATQALRENSLQTQVNI